MLDILEHRRRTVITTAVGVSIVGMALAYIAPDLLPPTALVGAAVGLAAVLLAIAAALGVDSVDLTIRGGRHVRAAGGDVVAELPGRPDPAQTVALADALEPLGDGPVRIAFTPVSRSITTVPRWTDALAVELSRREHRVVVLDLASGPDETGHPGVLEVVRDGVRLADAVRFDPELLLARLGPGEDDDGALAAWPRLADKLPSDVDVLLLSLPPVSRPGVLGAIGSADRVWLVAANDRTARVDLIAGLDAADRTGTPAEVVLLDPSQERPAPASAGVTASADDDDLVDEDALHEETWDEPTPESAWQEPEPEDRWQEPELEDGWQQPETDDAWAAPEPEPEPEPGPDAELDEDDRLPWDEPSPFDGLAEDTEDDSPGDADATDEFPTLLIPEAGETEATDEDGPRYPEDGPRYPEEPRDRVAPAPRPADTTRFTPFAGPEGPDDPVRVAAALQTLAQEVWARDDEA